MHTRLDKWVRINIKTISAEHFAIDPDKIEAEKKFDGIFVLRTNTDLNPLEAMLCYKQLWTVEQTFQTAKHLFSTRPIFHKLDETVRGHMFCSFLALVLKMELEERIGVRSAPRPAASLALRAQASRCRRLRGRSLLITPNENVVPSRRRGSDCRVCSAI